MFKKNIHLILVSLFCIVMKAEASGMAGIVLSFDKGEISLVYNEFMFEDMPENFEKEWFTKTWGSISVPLNDEEGINGWKHNYNDVIETTIKYLRLNEIDTHFEARIEVERFSASLSVTALEDGDMLFVDSLDDTFSLPHFQTKENIYEVAIKKLFDNLSKKKIQKPCKENSRDVDSKKLYVRMGSLPSSFETNEIYPICEEWHAPLQKKGSYMDTPHSSARDTILN